MKRLNTHDGPPASRRRAAALLLGTVLALGFVFTGEAAAHPLGNFTINHFARIKVGDELVRVRYVVDMAEIPTFQEMQTIDADGDGTHSSEEFDAYLSRVAAQYAGAILLDVDGARVPLEVEAKRVTTPAGAGGLPTLRVELDLMGRLSSGGTAAARRLRFEDGNYKDRTGWRELVVAPGPGVAVFDSSAHGSGVTDEIKAYPDDMLTAPLNERTAEMSFVRGDAPAGAKALSSRDGRRVEVSRDRLAELISVPELTVGVVLLSLFAAVVLGGLHAFSPGHGKTVVGAYLVGSRGTASHAAFLGLTVTITHTAGVFALGLITLFASQYVVPERLFPILSFVSGGIVVAIGLSLFVRRLRSALGATPPHAHAYGGHAHDHAHHHHHGEHTHDHAHGHALAHEHSHVDGVHTHDHEHAGDPTMPHSHGGREHSHLPPGADGSPVTWRSLLALGISGGLLPCPSALVVLLSAIALHRVIFGMLLVVAFSVGLAATLTGIGLAFLYAGRLMKRPAGFASGRLVRLLPVVSAFVITCVGIVICYEALVQAGVNFSALAGSLAAPGDAAGVEGGEPSLASMGAFAVLGLGLVFGLKHATEVDHVVAVSTIVSEHRNIWRSALVGGLWGAGHTAALLVVGTVVLVMRVAIPERVANWLEFGVALMIIGLGATAFVRALRNRSDIHVHRHQHDGHSHVHVHFHEDGSEHSERAASHTHAVKGIGFKPFIVGTVHGLAGSAALTLLVLTQIDSVVLGLLYLAVFGLGSIVGMLLMSGLVGLPFAFSARRLTGVHYGLQAVAGILSVSFGLWYAYETGVAGGLLRATL